MPKEETPFPMKFGSTDAVVELANSWAPVVRVSVVSLSDKETNFREAFQFKSLLHKTDDTLSYGEQKTTYNWTPLKVKSMNWTKCSLNIITWEDRILEGGRLPMNSRS
jgi:hypothetical protein